MGLIHHPRLRRWMLPGLDYLYLAVTRQHVPAAPPELDFGWFTPKDLNWLDMFDDSRRGAHLLLDRIDMFAHPRTTSADLGA